jgi:hypothetical protein
MNGTKFKLVENQRLRSDAAGNGAFGSRRGSRKHNGIDLVVREGEAVFAPFDGTLVRAANPYANDSNYSGFLIRSTENPRMEVKVFYCNPNRALIGRRVTAGQVIATGQAISKKHPSLRMTDHLHVELTIGGVLQDPTNYFL